MKQDYRTYTNNDHDIWSLLFQRQVAALEDKVCSAYFQSLDRLKEVLNPQNIPDFNKLNDTLKKETGWAIQVVDGLIPVDAFFELLSQKKFPSSTWLRTKEQLDYLEEPDMFHDVFGHIPLLVNPDYSRFMQTFGEIGYAQRHSTDMVLRLQRLYWYSIEFGLIREANTRKIYGAGIVSSCKETFHVFDKEIVVLPFDINHMMDRDFIISEIQQTYFEITSFQQLYESLLDLKL